MALGKLTQEIITKSNISVFGLAFIAAVSGICMILDGVLLKFIIYIQRVRKRLAPRVDRWIQHGVWQLQRRAYEARGEGSWIRLNQEIPLMQTAIVLSDLAGTHDPTGLPVVQAPASGNTATSPNAQMTGAVLSGGPNVSSRPSSVASTAAGSVVSPAASHTGLHANSATGTAPPTSEMTGINRYI